ncbi:MAG TPA: hypothetical protein DIW64_08170 [Cellvibrio sp.]|nr:hypothetical protein [Cellvibrio sp.]
MQKIFRSLMLVLTFWLVACGGGGGDPGSPSGGGAGQQAGTLQLQIISGGSDASEVTYSITASERAARAKVLLKNRGGEPMANIIVTFSETGPNLLKFSPESKTALTNLKGEAEIDLEPLSATSIGATTVTATASLPNGDVTGSQNLQITSAVVEGVDPQLVASALNFVSVDPSDRSIVIAGSGGNNRSESAILRFKVVDKNGDPVKDVRVNFAAVPVNAVTLNIPTAKSNADGIVTTSVSSKSTPTAVIIRAEVDGRNIVSQSDQLTVTTGIASAQGFDLSASKYNLDHDLSGDSSIVRIGIIDANGNPVSDGVPVIATTDFGRVGTSGRGGCTTSNGLCTVEYQVQNPRPADGRFVNVAVSTQVGTGQQISDSLAFTVTSVGWLDLYDINQSSIVGEFAPLSWDAKCKATYEGFIGTPSRFPAPSGTSIELKSGNDVVAANVRSGSPTLDRVFQRNRVSFQFELKDALSPGQTSIEVKFSVNRTTYSVFKTINYPACTPV